MARTAENTSGLSGTAKKLLQELRDAGGRPIKVTGRRWDAANELGQKGLVRWAPGGAGLLLDDASARNPGRGEHLRLSDQELEKAEQALSRAENHASVDHFGRALTDAVMAVSIASVALVEAEHAQDTPAMRGARRTMRQAGNLVLVSVSGIEKKAGETMGAEAALGALTNPSTARNQGRQPDVTPLFLIRTYSSSIISGNDEIYLVINTQGEVMDAIITESEDFGPVETQGYGNLSILELDVSGAQYRKLKKLAGRLMEISISRPTFRPGAGRVGGLPVPRPRPGGSRVPMTPNPSKKRLMR